MTLDDRVVAADPSETVLQVVLREGIPLPHLCTMDQPGYRPGGNCRSCVVEVEGERVLAPACLRKPQEGMVVRTASQRVTRVRQTVLELLRSHAPRAPLTMQDELAAACVQEGVTERPFRAGDRYVADVSHPAMAVNLNACITCARCVQACRDVQVNDVIGIAGRGYEAKIVFDFDYPMGSSTCVGCGECVQACPTGALSLSGGASLVIPDRTVDSVCPYCGVGCQLTYAVKDERIVSATGRDGPANRSRLCVKGRFGFDYVRHPDRLQVPLVRKAGVDKRADDSVDPSDWGSHFREATWEEALDRAAGGLTGIRDAHGGRALAGFGSAKGSNEDAYLFQKLVRTAFGTNNVDHCTRLCHASSVAALFEGLASAAVSNPFMDAAQAEVIIVIGANPAINHPVAATFIKNAVRSGAKLVVIDPRGQALSRHATHVLRFTPGTDVALLNAIMSAIVDEDLQDDDFIRRRTVGWEEMREHLKGYAPEAMAAVCGISASVIRDVARLYATAKTAMIFWGMGISQHTHGTDNARALIALALLAGQIGRPGTGLHPLRGQNNVQGASDAGLIPMFYPGYQRVEDPAVRVHFEELWGQALEPERGLTVVEIVDAILAGQIRGMYIMGENPAMSDPDLGHARSALASLQHLVVQDIFLTETATYADVILPASAALEKIGSFTNTDRRIQLGQTVVDPPGQAKQDWWIIQEIGRRMGLEWHYTHPREAYEEMRSAAFQDALAGAPWERLEAERAVTYPVDHTNSPGRSVLFESSFPTSDGRARFVPAHLRSPDETPDEHYPMVLTTGRLLEHWHTGTMTRRSVVLDTLEPNAGAYLSPADLLKLGVSSGELVRVTSRRGEIEVAARSDPGVPSGVVFIPFHFVEAAANLLTNSALDPDAKIPEFKYCAVRVVAVRGS
jgi:formate dehydrogenase major subunit